MTYDEALNRVINYLADDEFDDYETRPPNERRNHIWCAIAVLIRHRDKARSSHTHRQ
jgi:hypothetical protein